MLLLYLKKYSSISETITIFIFLGSITSKINFFQIEDRQIFKICTIEFIYLFRYPRKLENFASESAKVSFICQFNDWENCSYSSSYHKMCKIARFLGYYLLWIFRRLKISLLLKLNKKVLKNGYKIRFLSICQKKIT